MLLWFCGVSVAAVWLVFRSPALDYRLVMVGSVLPVGEVVLGGPRLLHTLLASVSALVLIMLATRQRRLLRRRLIGLPIGLMMHLVLDGVWARTQVFWWPFFGFGFGDGGLPELSHGVGLVLVLEVLGAGALAWCWKAFDLADPDNRRLFLTTGHLNRDVVA
ncbi:MAG: hypothetical protein R2726_00435 [Acidimicrobiales bacterium]